MAVSRAKDSNLSGSPIVILHPIYSPGWGPVRVGAHMGPYGPLWAHVGPYGSSWTGLGRSGHVRFPTFGRILHVLGSKISL